MPTHPRDAGKRNKKQTLCQRRNNIEMTQPTKERREDGEQISLALSNL
jgi:hypothetical protein